MNGLWSNRVPTNRLGSNRLPTSRIAIAYLPTNRLRLNHLVSNRLATNESLKIESLKVESLTNESLKKLLQRNLPPFVVRTLLSWYSDQRVTVSWDKTISTDFSISNGVRQGGVLSPILFTVYIDELLQQLKQLGVGCFWKHHFIGAVCYADDIALLAPSPSALRLMLKTCTLFAESHSLLFNAKKTQLIKFSCCRTDDSVELTFCGDKLQLNKSVVHLGHILSSDLSDDWDIIAKRKDLCKKTNCMLSIFFEL